MKLNIFFLATSCQKLTELDNECKCMVTEVAADALGKEWKYQVVQISGRSTNKVFLRSKVSWHMAECASCWVGGIPVPDQGELERVSISVFRDALWMTIWVVLTCLLFKKGEDITGLTDTVVPWQLGPKRASKDWKFFNL